MARFIVLMVLSSLAVACNASQAQESTRAESYEGELTVVPLSESALKELDAFLSQYLPTRAGMTGGMLVTDVDEAGNVVGETLFLPEALRNLSGDDACYARFAQQDTWDDGALTTNVWCQAVDYDDSATASRRLQWDKYRYNRYFLMHISSGINCFTSSGKPNYTAIIRPIHDKLCNGSLP
jgi:hypothetical protein